MLQRIGGEVYRDMRRPAFVGAYKRAVVAHKIFDAQVHNFTMHAFARFPTDVDHFHCQPCDATWGWTDVDRLSAADLLTRGTSAPSRGPIGEQSLGCCEKSALNRGLFERIDGLPRMAGCFRDWETPASSLPKHHQKMLSD